ncbi:MAG: response regulator [Paracoccaceae bacterium]
MRIERDFAGGLAIERATVALAGRRVLLVEDEALVALDVAWTLEDAGAVVLGPAATLEQAVGAAAAEAIDAAVMDVSLRGIEAFPALDTLAHRGVPFVLHTGHLRRGDLAGAYPDAPLVPKPATPESLLVALARCLALA